MTESIILWGQVAGAVGAILAVVGLIVKWTVLKPLKVYIDQATYPIQPGANGGSSLPDVAKRVEQLHGMLQMHIDTHHNA